MHLGVALHRYGVPAHQLEDILSQVTRRFGVPSHFLSTPTSITASFGTGAQTKLYMTRADQGEMNLEKLSLLDELSEQVIIGTLDPLLARSQIDTIHAAAGRYSGLEIMLCYGLASAAVGRLFGGGWVEVCVSALIGLSIGVLASLTAHFPTWARVFEMFAAMLAALLSAAAVPVLGPYAVHTATLAGVIILVPGMTVTTAMTELSTGNLVSGTSRLMGAAVGFMKLGFGAALGTQVGKTWFGTQVDTPPHVPGWTAWPALVIAAMALAIILQARPRDVGWILLNACVGLAGSHLGIWAVGPELAPFLAAFLVTLGSNMHARVWHRAAAVTQVPATLLLVPGSVGFRSVFALLERNVLTGMEIGFSMALTAMALVAGILLANLVLPARRFI